MTDQRLLSDRYQILQTLGSGGFGETFLAEDTHMPSRRRCVVKKLHPTQNNPALEKLIRDRFQREAAMLEELSGGNRQIPALYAYFYSETDRQYYIVQEWIDGDTLSSLVTKKGVLDENQVRRILTDVLPVFSYIHSKSIVHRDIKPDNIILRHSDKLPVLIDFGAVREAMGTIMNSQGQPTQSIVIGTPGYMPSEQSIGRPVYNSDLYSLGLTAIYLLTGQAPTNLPTDPNSAEILWRDRAPQISSAFAQILDRAISYHHRDRYPSAAEFLTALSGSPAPLAQPVNNIPVNKSQVATYAVAPAQPINTQVSLAPTANNNPILVGGAIATTIIGGALATALFFNSSNSKITSQVTVAPASPTPSIVMPSPETSVSATVSSVPSPTPIKPPFPDSPASTPIAVTPLNSPAPKPSPISSASTSTPQPTIASPFNNPNSSIDPVTTVTGYYNELNGRNYSTAWSKLPPDLQDNRQVHPAGYKSFQDWWNSVESIEVQNVQVLNRTPRKAEMIARTIYHMKNGRSAPYSLRYFLEWNDASQNWQIAKIRN